MLSTCGFRLLWNNPKTAHLSRLEPASTHAHSSKRVRKAPAPVLPFFPRHFASGAPSIDASALAFPSAGQAVVGQGSVPCCSAACPALMRPYSDADLSRLRVCVLCLRAWSFRAALTPTAVLPAALRPLSNFDVSSSTDTCVWQAVANSSSTPRGHLHCRCWPWLTALRLLVVISIVAVIHVILWPDAVCRQK